MPGHSDVDKILYAAPREGNQKDVKFEPNHSCTVLWYAPFILSLSPFFCRGIPSPLFFSHTFALSLSLSLSLFPYLYVYLSKSFSNRNSNVYMVAKFLPKLSSWSLVFSVWVGVEGGSFIAMWVMSHGQAVSYFSMKWI